MLRGIPPIISPELIKILMEMGHGDEIIIADGNFPAASCAQRLIRYDGHSIPALLEAILQFLPLDTFVEKPVSLMGIVPGDSYVPEIWKTYETIIKKYDDKVNQFEYVERYEFYERTKKAYAVIATGENVRYANIILKKGNIES